MSAATLTGAAKYRQWARANGVIDSDRCEKREWAQSTMAGLRSEARGALLTPDGWEMFGRACLICPKYSWRNAALVALQSPDALMLATYMRWESLGCHVRAGSEPIRIVSPPQPGVGFGTICLHDVSQLIDVPDELADEAVSIGEYAREALGALEIPAPSDDGEINELAAAMRAATIGD